MPVPIISASGTAYGAAVGPDNRLWVNATISGIPTVNANITGSIMIGSVSASVDSIYIQSGANLDLGSAWTNIGSVHVSNIVAGSIVYMPVITTSTQTSTIDTGSISGILADADTVLINHIITVGSNFNLTGFDLTGTVDGKFSLKENAKLVSQYRSSAANQYVSKDFTNPIKFTSGGSIMIFVEHEELLSQGFQGSLYGYED